MKSCRQKQPVNYGSFNLAKHRSLISQKSSMQRAHSVNKNKKKDSCHRRKTFGLRSFAKHLFKQSYAVNKQPTKLRNEVKS